MIIDDAGGLVFRPPSEARSFILRVTIGCSHNTCRFCDMYKASKFRIRPMEEIEGIIERGAYAMPSSAGFSWLMAMPWSCRRTNS